MRNPKSMTTEEIENEIADNADRLDFLLEELGERARNPEWGKHITAILRLKAREIKYHRVIIAK